MKFSTIIIGLVLILLFIAAGFVVYDQLFSPPKVHSGVILEKIYIPEHKVAGPYALPYGNYKSYKYTLSAQRYHQWIALVVADDGDTIQVHCSSDHYENKVVGDTLLFKEYKGDLLGIDYFAHSEEDTLDTDIRFVK